ncbi:hypothetical protein ACTXT7_007155 [Hymenolepis weldensis]
MEIWFTRFRIFLVQCLAQVEEYGYHFAAPGNSEEEEANSGSRFVIRFTSGNDSWFHAAAAQRNSFFYTVCGEAHPSTISSSDFTNGVGKRGSSSNSSSIPGSIKISVRNRPYPVSGIDRYQGTAAWETWNNKYCGENILWERMLLTLYSRNEPGASSVNACSGASFSQSDDNSRPLSPETDAEDEFNYPLPEENQPIMLKLDNSKVQ